MSAETFGPATRNGVGWKIPMRLLDRKKHEMTPIQVQDFITSVAFDVLVHFTCSVAFLDLPTSCRWHLGFLICGAQSITMTHLGLLIYIFNVWCHTACYFAASDYQCFKVAGILQPQILALFQSTLLVLQMMFALLALRSPISQHYTNSTCAIEEHSHTLVHCIRVAPP